MANQQATRKRVLFSGRVQGVGFRYTTSELASRFDLVGTVRNLDDGRVELIAEGAESEINGLLAAIRDRFAGSIDGESCEDSAPAGELAGFSILR